jgi:heme A synthase
VSAPAKRLQPESVLTALLSLTALTGTTAYALAVPRRHALGLVGAAMILGGLWLLWYGLIGHP